MGSRTLSPSLGSRRRNACIGVSCLDLSRAMWGLSKLYQWKNLSTGSVAGAVWNGLPTCEGRPPTLRVVTDADAITNTNSLRSSSPCILSILPLVCGWRTRATMCRMPRASRLFSY